MTGAEKAAVLLLYLGPDATAKVFGHMDDIDIKKISQSMSRLGHVPREEIATVVAEFTDITNPETGFFSQGEEFVKKILEKALGPLRAETLLQEIRTAGIGDMTDMLASMDPRTIANFFS